MGYPWRNQLKTVSETHSRHGWR